MDKEKIGIFIKNLREKKKISQEKLAQNIGVSIKNIQKWEDGRKIPNMCDLELLSFQLGVSVNDLLSGKKNKMQDDDEIFYYTTIQRNKNRKMIFLGSIIFAIFILIFCFFQFTNKVDKVNIYKISGESENFYYANAMFISSNIKNIYIYGDLIPKNDKINERDIKMVTFKSGDRLILGSNTLPKQISIENYGYNELFPKEVVDNLDNWYLEITYNTDKETTTEVIKLKNQYVMDKIKVKPIA